MKTLIPFLAFLLLFATGLSAYGQDFDESKLDETDAELLQENSTDIVEDFPEEEPIEAIDDGPVYSYSSDEEPAQEEPEEIESKEEQKTETTETMDEEIDSGFRWSDFVDTKLNITYADDNLLENNEFSPAMGIGQRNVSEFSGDTGDIQPTDINHTHLVLHHKSDGYLPGVLTEAALVIRFKLATDPTSGSPEPSVGDDGSFLRLGYIFDHKTKKKTILDLTGFPFDADSFLLGFHYDLTWAGESSFPQNRDPVPGLRLGFQHPRFYVFAGFKTHLQPKKDTANTERVPVETVYSGLFGAGVKIVKGLMLEANGGIIQKGDNPNMPEVTDKESRDNILAGGVSSRISYNWGMPIGDRMDLRLYENDPRKRLKLARSDKYEAGKFSFMVSTEFNYLTQNLQDPDSTDGTKAFPAMAALLAAKFKYDYLRIHLEGSWRTLEFLLFDTPGYTPFQAFPDSVEKRDEFTAVTSIDYHIKPAYLTLGLTFGYKVPATYQGAKGVPIAVVKRRSSSSSYISPFNRSIEILPEGKDAFDIIEVKFDTQFDLSDFMTFLLEVSYTLDNNRVKLAESEADSSVLYKKFEDDSVTNRLGLALIVQAKF